MPSGPHQIARARDTSARADLQKNVPRTILQMVFLFVAAALLLLIQN
jgi:hypothetical protein